MSTTNNKKVIFWVVETGLLIALLIVAQLLTFVVPKSIPLASQFLTGSLVNLILIVGAATVGFSGAAIAGVLSPIFAVVMGQMKFPPMIPVVMLGNIVIVFVAWFFLKLIADKAKGVDLPKGVIGIILGAAAKCAFLWAGTAVVMVPLFLSALPQETKGMILMMFSWPQGITALIGGALALLVLPAIRAYRRNRV